METKNKLYGEGLITFLLVVFRIFFLLASFTLIIMGIFGLISLFAEVPDSKLSFKVLFSLADEGVLNSAEETGITKISMRGGTGFIVTDALPKGFMLFIKLIELLQFAIYLFFLKLLIQILEAAKNGAFLIIENAIRLRWIAFLCIALYVLGIMTTIISTSYLSDKLEFANLEFINYNLHTFIASKESIFYYLFLLVIAEAFRVGASLKKENDLTI